MSTSTTQLDEGLAENIVLAAHVSSTIVLAGLRQFDRFLIGDATGKQRTQTIERVCHESLSACATWVFDPAKEGSVVLSIGESELSLKTSLPTKTGDIKRKSLIDVCDAFSSLTASDDEERFVLVVNASLLVEDSAVPRDADFSLLKVIEHFSRNADRKHTLILRVGKTTAVPNMILSSPFVRVVHIPAASRDVRHAYSCKRGELVAKTCEVRLNDMANTSSNATEDWTLEQVNALFQTAESQELSQLSDFEELARAVRIGTTSSPWAGDRIRSAVASAKDTLTKRVLGQPTAVDAVVSSLIKAVIGLSTAHQSQGSQAPRAVFFFSGPTGTGKTELAKAISELVFGQEQILRFDCGELRQEHAVARLIGAPPGYVGYDSGGELTEGIKEKPNSVVLFDEIEKAHPRLLDTLLSVLDDGRLTSGQGETSFFGQSILIFTSNLGMYEEVKGANGKSVRKPRFNYDTPFEEITDKVREAIREEFVSVLGRPELLGRLGGAKSIVVFDFLREVEMVCKKFVRNISMECKRLHGIKLIVDDSIIDAVVDATNSRPDALILGGRGLIPELNRLLTNPLAYYLFETPLRECTLNASIQDDHTTFVVQS